MSEAVEVLLAELESKLTDDILHVEMSGDECRTLVTETRRLQASAAEFAAKELRACAKVLADLARHPETSTTGGAQRVRAFEIAVETMNARASKLNPFKTKEILMSTSVEDQRRRSLKGWPLMASLQKLAASKGQTPTRVVQTVEGDVAAYFYWEHHKARVQTEDDDTFVVSHRGHEDQVTHVEFPTVQDVVANLANFAVLNALLPPSLGR